jgi:hypothetical protein
MPPPGGSAGLPVGLVRPAVPCAPFRAQAGCGGPPSSGTPPRPGGTPRKPRPFAGSAPSGASARPGTRGSGPSRPPARSGPRPGSPGPAARSILSSVRSFQGSSVIHSRKVRITWYSADWGRCAPGASAPAPPRCGRPRRAPASIRFRSSSTSFRSSSSPSSRWICFICSRRSISRCRSPSSSWTLAWMSSWASRRASSRSTATRARRIRSSSSSTSRSFCLSGWEGPGRRPPGRRRSPAHPRPG